jgi:hypothetical protein
MSGVWSKEKAWEWYDSIPWIRGCNFMSSDCANRIDQWQALGFEGRLATADRELALAASIGFNSIRLILEFIVWDQEHDGFMERFDRYLSTAYKYNIRSMIVFGNDCMPPKDENYRPPRLGKQHYDWGYHGGRKHSPHAQHNKMGYSLLDEPELAERHYKMVREIMEKYKHDPRILIWDLYNEPGHSRREQVTMPHLQKFFEIAREVAPDQPITTGLWRGILSDKLSPLDELIVWNSDVISYHSYGSYQDNILIIKKLKQYGRPIINTEWLARMTHNTVQEMFPLFYLEKIGCYNWGFVVGLYQTYEPWNNIWQLYDEGKANHVDFTKWLHDLFRPNLRPYDPKEIEIIKRFTSLADKEFAEKQNQKGN